MTSIDSVRLAVIAGICGVLLAGAAPDRAQAQTPPAGPCPAQQQNLIPVPEIKSVKGKLKATLKVVDGVRTVWGSGGDRQCYKQRMRFFEGFDSTYPRQWPAGQDPIPGPTLRARVGDLVELTFFNQVNPADFAGSLDHSAAGTFEACDKYTTTVVNNGNRNQYGLKGGSGTGIDQMPDCLHGSSTTNVHFHGTHTTPSTTGDNVLLFIRPSLRVHGQVLPSESTTHALLSEFFAKCEANTPSAAAPWPTKWSDMPQTWRTVQARLLLAYDHTASYAGHKPPLPPSMQLSPVNAREIAAGGWPQYQLGADPYCFPLPKYEGKMVMGQSPGTHWYHAHKHGSTALNVANGMTGAFIIEGDYDDALHRYYGANLGQKVLMIQQLSTSPFPLLNPLASNGPPGFARAQLSVNGRRNPVVTMKPGEVQMWRIINGAFRDAVEFTAFTNAPASATANPCDPNVPVPSKPPLWRQIAQDGVQFALANYTASNGQPNIAFNLAPANRADLLVQAPTQPGKYALCVVRNQALFVQSTPAANAASPGTVPRAASVLLTINVTGTGQAMAFIPAAQFPKQPYFLRDIPKSAVVNTRTLTFGAGNSTIDGKTFQDGQINQLVKLGNVEEWTIKNEANDKAHPFHIHINPFQIVELFEPNRPEAIDPNNPCYVNPSDPTTFKPCPSTQPHAPWVWWDTFAIPSGQQITLACTKLSDCPAPIQSYTKCPAAPPPPPPGATPPPPQPCTEFIPGWFKMRSRFVDFTGIYVLHCHILVHEDRGMMQIVEVSATPLKSKKMIYTHH
jgi:FtsP/CotA-like multicopper oxidase with cupredoxin domain